jgi:hypothetical protein
MPVAREHERHVKPPAVTFRLLHAVTGRQVFSLRLNYSDGDGLRPIRGEHPKRVVGTTVRTLPGAACDDLDCPRSDLAADEILGPPSGV